MSIKGVFWPLRIVCGCGGKVDKDFSTIGITNDYKFVFAGICPNCNEKIFLVLTFEDLIAIATTNNSAEPEGESKIKYTPKDQNFLRDLKISLD
jgi:hypothetical protein